MAGGGRYLDTLQVTATEAGWYHLYDTHVAESGNSQTNEHAYIRIPSTVSPTGTPAAANWEDDWIVADSDNDSTPTEPVYLGTFWIDEGTSTLELHHACPHINEGECTDFHIPEPATKDCSTTNWNSVHLELHGWCASPTE